MQERIRFSGPVLASIFLGRIHRWNDPKLTALNPGLPLPDHEIAVVHRLDSSGTTYVWTDYLSKVSPQLAVEGRCRENRSLAGRTRMMGERRSRGLGQAESMEHWIRAACLRYP
jgi:ABC-type phosphate transport system substrate-binding protein